jgi:predicted nucleotidyltransferase component of viral defense system
MNSVLEQMLLKYADEDSYGIPDQRAVHEVMQQVALAGLYRGGFFDKAAFYGGTCLRIFYGLSRFSEDMDFSLLSRSGNAFRIEDYFDALISEFDAYGQIVSITKKKKSSSTAIESAFLKGDTAVYDLRLDGSPKVKIKIEVDTDPPLGFRTEPKLSLQPFSFMTNCYVLSDLYAGKMHALLYRNWKNRVKGRDWYDFEWYVRNEVCLNLQHLAARIAQSEKTAFEEITPARFLQILKNKIGNTDIDLVKSEAAPFLRDPEEIRIWSTDYFLRLADLIRFEL